MTTLVRMEALVDLGVAVVAEQPIHMRWLAAGGTDTVTVDLLGGSPVRIGTVTGLDTARPRLVVADGAPRAWLDAVGVEAAIVAAVTEAYQDRPQAH